MDYSNLSDNVSGYLTANEEECDNSQYLSILSQDITLEDMNGTLTNVKNEESNEEQLVALEDTNQPLLFNVDGTNGFYSVVAQDEDGNLQKYQIQYSEDINGEVMPVLETIQFLPLEYEEEVISEENCSRIQICESNDDFVIANEQYISDKNDYNVTNMEQEQINTNNEWNISGLQCTSYNVPMKMEPENYYDQTPILETNFVKVENPIELASIDTDPEVVSNEARIGDEDKHLVAVQHLEINHCINEDQLYEETIEHDTLGHVSPNENQLQSCENNTNPELYQVSNTVALNLGNNLDQNVNCVLKESVDQPKSNILKKSSQRSLLKDFIGEEQRILYLQAPPEKENIKILDIDGFIKPSSRSLLKCNQPALVKETDSAKIKNASRNVAIKSIPCNNEIRQSQTYNRTRESKQARQFMNFINSTTIPQVPERKERLPRKQQITPLKHQNEDIVVKEMIVSSKGFVEPVSAEERKHLPVTEYVELIDSGDESSPECNSKKKRKNSLKNKLIEISDTDESDSMELEPERARCAVGNKRDMKKRGRPPKMINNNKKQTYPSSPPKISRLDSEVERVTSTLQVIRMENEITPLQNITKAKNSVDVHKSEECTAKNTNNQPIVQKESSETNKSKESLIFKNGFEYKYECEKCKSKFVNKFLLNRHDCVVRRGSTLSCDICKLKFSNNTSYNQHKSSHINSSTMVKPNVTKIPKAKAIPEKETAYNSTRLSTARPQSVVNSRPPVKIPSRQSILPTRSTKTLSIKNARHSELPTKVRKSSVPLKSVGVITKHPAVPIENNSSGNTGKKCIDVNNSKPLTRGNDLKPPSIEVTPKKTPKEYTFKCEIQCDKCSEQFHNNTTWFEHQVLHHGFKTPDKTVGAKKQKKIVKEKITHSGLSVAPVVAKNFVILRSKLQQI